jgi:hypothetical protein
MTGTWCDKTRALKEESDKQHTAELEVHIAKFEADHKEALAMPEVW